jgi:hypothetical protein
MAETDLDLENIRVLGAPGTISLYSELARTALIVLNVENAAVKLWSARWGIICIVSGVVGFNWEIAQNVGDPHCSRPNYDLTFEVTKDGELFTLDLARLRDELAKQGGIETMHFLFGNRGLRVMYPESQPNRV